MLAAMTLGMTAVAQAQSSDDPATRRHRTLGQLELPAAADHAVATQDHNPTEQDQTTADATLRRLLAKERSSIPSGTPTQVPAPVRPAESSGHSVSLLAWLGVLAALLALAGGLAVMAARRDKPQGEGRPAGLSTTIATPSEGAAAPTRQPHRQPNQAMQPDPHPSATTRSSGDGWGVSAAHSATAVTDRAPARTAAAASPRMAASECRRPARALGSLIEAR